MKLEELLPRKYFWLQRSIQGDITQVRAWLGVLGCILGKGHPPYVEATESERERERQRNRLRKTGRERMCN